MKKNKIYLFEEYKSKRLNENEIYDYVLNEDGIYELTGKKFNYAVTEEELKVLFPTEEEYIKNVGLDYDNNIEDENGNYYPTKPFYVLVDLEIDNYHEGGGTRYEPAWSDYDLHINDIKMPLFDNASEEEKKTWSEEKIKIIEKMRDKLLDAAGEIIEKDDDLFIGHKEYLRDLGNDY